MSKRKTPRTMQDMKHDGYRKVAAFACPRCKAEMSRYRRTTCAFDGRDKRFKANHYDCVTIRMLKHAIMRVGTRALGVEERESRGTSWVCTTDKGAIAIMYWKKAYESGFADFATERSPGGVWGALSLETADEVIAMGAEGLEAAAMGVDEDTLENVKERLGEDDE